MKDEDFLFCGYNFCKPFLFKGKYNISLKINY